MKMKGNRLIGAAVLLGSAASLSACGGNNAGQSDPAASPMTFFGLPGAMAPATPTSPAPPVVPIDQAKFSFAPVTGAPATVLMNVSAELGKEAFTQHVTLVPPDDPSATYVVKGYLSAIGDVSGTILVYVWDVFDTSGRRVHRISGQETTPSGGQDPWSGIDRYTVTSVARRTIGALVAWGTPPGQPATAATEAIAITPATFTP